MHINTTATRKYIILLPDLHLFPLCNLIQFRKPINNNANPPAQQINANETSMTSSIIYNSPRDIFYKIADMIRQPDINIQALKNREINPGTFCIFLRLLTSDSNLK